MEISKTKTSGDFSSPNSYESLSDIESKNALDNKDTFVHKPPSKRTRSNFSSIQVI